MESFVGELAVFRNKSEKEKLYASFHPRGRILEENNDAYGHGFGMSWYSEDDLCDWAHFVPLFCLFWAALSDQ